MTYRNIVESFADNAEFTIDKINLTTGNIIFRAAPLLAPAPSAIAIYNSLSPSWGIVAALILAAVVEGLGYAAAETALRVWYLNRAIGKIQIRQWIPNALFIIYFVAALATIFGFETLPAIMSNMDGTITRSELAAHVAPLVYPFLTVVGAGLYGIKSLLGEGERELDRREQIQEESKNFTYERERAEWELEMERKRAMQELALEKERKAHDAKLESERLKLESKLSKDASGVANGVSGNVASSVANAGNQPSDTVGMRQKKVLHMLQNIDTPDQINKSQMAEELGVSRHTIIRDIKALEESGKLSLNGHVVIKQG